VYKICMKCRIQNFILVLMDLKEGLHLSCGISKTVMTSLKYLHKKQRLLLLYYVNNQQDAALAVLLISHCKITLQVSDAFCAHHQEY
jgi:hypothetical protein